MLEEKHGKNYTTQRLAMVVNPYVGLFGYVLFPFPKDFRWKRAILSDLARHISCIIFVCVLCPSMFSLLCSNFCFYVNENLFASLQPTIDKGSLEMLNIECPRIVINPKPSLLGYRGQEVPREALPDATLDEPFVTDIDPKTWLVSGFVPKPTSLSPSSSNELSIAERFRLAFAERDARLAPKRAKNARQHQRRAEREWMMSSSEAKAIALASKATRSLHKN